MKTYQLFINGQWVDAASGETFDDLNPFDGQIYARVAKAGLPEVDQVMAAAYATRKQWAATKPGERAGLLHKAAGILEEKRPEFAEVLAAEGGSTFGKAMFEISQTIDLLNTAGEDCKRLLGETRPSDADKLSMTLYRPRGTVVAISPWNFPLVLSMYKVAYSLATGNTVVLKPSSETPVIGLMIGELFDQAGAPAGTVNVLTGPGRVLGDALIDDKRSSFVALTGETETGRHVAQRAAAQLKEYTLELGGKDPLIILADADLDYAVNAAAFGAFLHQGQICMSVERIIVEEAIVAEFAERLADKGASLPCGDPSQPTTVIGPLINDEQVLTIDGQVKDALAKGARLLTGGSAEGRVYKPTVLSEVRPDMKVFIEETFGPVAPILAVKDEKEALEAANATVYGLAAGIITNDLQKALYLGEGVEAGMVHINDTSVHAEASCPFGGCKQSGQGREGGRWSMEELSELKWLTIQRGQQVFPF